MSPLVQRPADTGRSEGQQRRQAWAPTPNCGEHFHLSMNKLKKKKNNTHILNRKWMRWVCGLIFKRRSQADMDKTSSRLLYPIRQALVSLQRCRSVVCCKLRLILSLAAALLSGCLSDQTQAIHPIFPSLRLSVRLLLSPFPCLPDDWSSSVFINKKAANEAADSCKQHF